MLKKLTLRWRLTLVTALLIAVCCVGLSTLLSVSAYRMADRIDTALEATADAPQHPSAGRLNKAKNTYLMESLLFTVIAVVSGGIVTYYLTGKALAPLHALSEQVKNRNAHNLDEALPVPPAHDELAELTVSFNDMTAKLARAFTAQKRFSANAAHELRTPLTVLQTKLDVFRKKETHTTGEADALADALQKQVFRLRSLVTELLEIANLEHTLHIEPVSLQELLCDVTAELSPVAEERGVTLTLSGGDHTVCGDYDLLYRAFYNLTENAIKYNLPDGRVTIRPTSCGGGVAVTLTDTGIGIPDPMKKQIFEPFYRVDKSRSRAMGGAGLGLALAEAVVREHGGTLTVADNPGGGSCFTVTLPQNE